MKKQLASLALPVPAADGSAYDSAISDRTIYLPPNGARLDAISLRFEQGTCYAVLSHKQEHTPLVLRSGSWTIGSSKRLGPNLLLGAPGHFSNLPPAQVAATYRWTGERTLEITLRYVESPHHERITCRFDGADVQVDIWRSDRPDAAVTVEHARLALPGQRPPRLIVRGDDMGYTHSGNLALIQSFETGIETSIEVIVPSPWFPEAAKLLAAHPQVDVGVHLAITSEWDHVKWRPLTDAPSLRDQDGYLYPMVFPNPNYPGQSVSEQAWQLPELEREFRAQIELALRKIPRISHLSAHMGCTDLSPEVRAMTKRLAQEYRIDIDPVADFGVQYQGYGGPGKTSAEKKASFLAMLGKLEPGKTYLFVDHPGLNDAELQAVSHIGYEDVAADRQGVTDLFTDPEVKAAIHALGIHLISYRDLTR